MYVETYMMKIDYRVYMEFEIMSLQKMNSTVTVVLTHYGYLMVTYLLCVSHRECYYSMNHISLKGRARCYVQSGRVLANTKYVTS